MQLIFCFACSFKYANLRSNLAPIDIYYSKVTDDCLHVRLAKYLRNRDMLDIKLPILFRNIQDKYDEIIDDGHEDARLFITSRRHRSSLACFAVF